VIRSGLPLIFVSFLTVGKNRTAFRIPALSLDHLSRFCAETGDISSLITGNNHAAETDGDRQE
jgi:hypothetical protein